MKSSAALAGHPLIACVGHAALDHIFQVDTFPVQATKTPARSYQATGGGMAANAAVAAARLGARVRFVGAVGDDLAGGVVREQLAQEGIDLTHLQVVAGATTSVSGVIVDALGERHIFNHRGNALARAALPPERAFEGSDAVLVDPRWMAGATRALHWARAKACLSVLDADIAPPEDLAALVPLAAWSVFSEPGLALWAPGWEVPAALQQARNQGAHHSAVTLGAQGVVFTAAEGLQAMAAFPVDVRDTLGAGDVFHGALAVALARGMPVHGAFRYASAAAALKCTQPGGARAAPTHIALSEFMKGLP